jgi:Arc/MetJ family transcription regulator
MTGWKENMGMSQDTGLVKIYAPMSHKETWQQEADEKNYKSTSKYLHELIQEARAIRDEGFLAPQSSEQEVQRLKKKIEELEDRLAKTRQQKRDSVTIDDAAFLKQFLTEEYQTYDEVLRRVVESDTVDELLREPIEDELYFLAAREEVEFEHGHGWRLAGGEK